MTSIGCAEATKNRNKSFSSGKSMMMFIVKNSASLPWIILIQTLPDAGGGAGFAAGLYRQHLAALAAQFREV